MDFEDDLQPEFGTTNSLVHLFLSARRHHPPLIPGATYRVTLHAPLRAYTVVVEAMAQTSQLVTFAFPRGPDHPEVAPLEFLVRLEGFQTTDLRFRWLRLPHFSAASFITEAGLSYNLDYLVNSGTFTLVRKLQGPQRAKLVHSYAVLGKVGSLSALGDTYGVDIAAPCPETGQNILHVALVENWPEVVTLALRSPTLFEGKDRAGITPQVLLDSLPPEDPRKVVIALSILLGLRFSLASLPQPQATSGFDTSALDFALLHKRLLALSKRATHEARKQLPFAPTAITPARQPLFPSPAPSSSLSSLSSLSASSIGVPSHSSSSSFAAVPAHPLPSHPAAAAPASQTIAPVGFEPVVSRSQLQPPPVVLIENHAAKEGSQDGDDGGDEDEDEDEDEDDGEGGDGPARRGRKRKHPVDDENPAKRRTKDGELDLRRCVKPSLPDGFKQHLIQHFLCYPMRIDLAEFEPLDKEWILFHFKKSVSHRRNADLIVYLRHRTSGYLVVACLSLLMERLKRPQRYLAHLMDRGFRRAKFAKKSPDLAIPALAPFFASIPDWITSRPEFESFCGSLKVFYLPPGKKGPDEVPQEPRPVNQAEMLFPPIVGYLPGASLGLLVPRTLNEATSMTGQT